MVVAISGIQPVQPVEFSQVLQHSPFQKEVQQNEEDYAF